MMLEVFTTLVVMQMARSEARANDRPMATDTGSKSLMRTKKQFFMRAASHYVQENTQRITVRQRVASDRLRTPVLVNCNRKLSDFGQP